MAPLRPSTSGGLSTKGGSNLDTSKRMSKDDMFFNSGSRRTAMASQIQAMANNRMSRDDMYIRSRMAAMSQFHIPVRGSTITPEHSPDYPVAHEVSIPVRMQTPESMTSGEIQIGMALGSPVHIPSDPSRWQAQFPPASPQTTLMSSEPSPATGAPNGSLQRKKTGRKKLFGLFGGGRKNASETGEGSERDRKTSLLTKGSAASQSTVSVVPPKTPTRSNTQSERKTPKHKPIMLRSNTMPYSMEDQSPPQPKSAGPPNLRSKASEPYLRQSNPSQQTPFHQQAVPKVPPLPRLDVHIPDTKMERYSVMFSDVLNQGPRPEPAVSLLARRQATLERLKTINDGIAAEAREEEKDRARPRRATSPQPQPQQYPDMAPSPRLSIFPAPPTHRPMETPLSRMTRSNTSPGRLPSPTQQTFDARQRVPPTRPMPQRLEVPNPFEMNPPDPRPISRHQEPIYPTDTSFHFGPDKSGLILDSPTSMNSHEEIIISQPFRPTLHEPQWQMISPSVASSAVTSTTSGRRGRSPSAASTSTHVTKPSSELDPQDAALQNAVEVSIARQISISRQQRNLLRPLQTRPRADTKPSGSGSGSGNGAGPGSAVGEGRSPLGMTVVKAPSPSRLGRDEPIKEVQTSTPTLVHSRGSPVAPEHRKSSWVVLESD